MLQTSLSAAGARLQAGACQLGRRSGQELQMQIIRFSSARRTRRPAKALMIRVMALQARGACIKLCKHSKLCSSRRQSKASKLLARMHDNLATPRIYHHHERSRIEDTLKLVSARRVQAEAN
eukprot:6181948-Pleurochrysis_carterae.AAC.3